jgi:low temperature requirement protein LtrA
MTEFAFDVRWVDLVIAITMLEAMAVFAYRRRTGRGMPTRALVLSLAPGLFLIAALRCSVTAAGWGWIMLFLAAAGVGHAADLWQRWPRH